LSFPAFSRESPRSLKELQRMRLAWVASLREGAIHAGDRSAGGSTMRTSIAGCQSALPTSSLRLQNNLPGFWTPTARQHKLRLCCAGLLSPHLVIRAVVAHRCGDGCRSKPRFLSPSAEPARAPPEKPPDALLRGIPARHGGPSGIDLTQPLSAGIRRP